MFIAILTGIVLSGKLAELYGRINTLLSGILISILSEFVLTCSLSPRFFLVLILFCGISISSSLTIPYMWIFEVVDKAFRPHFYFLITIPVMISFGITNLTINYFFT